MWKCLKSIERNNLYFIPGEVPGVEYKYKYKYDICYIKLS